MVQGTFNGASELSSLSRPFAPDTVESNGQSTKAAFWGPQMVANWIDGTPSPTLVGLEYRQRARDVPDGSQGGAPAPTD